MKTLRFIVMAFVAVLVSGISVACSDEDSYERKNLFEHDSDVNTYITIDEINPTSARIIGQHECRALCTTDKSELENIETVKKEILSSGISAEDIWLVNDIYVNGLGLQYYDILDKLTPNTTYYILPYWVSHSSYGKKETYTYHYGDIMSFTTTSE